jgi:hypothetical protein
MGLRESTDTLFTISVMSNLMSQANIQMQKTGERAGFYA